VGVELAGKDPQGNLKYRWGFFPLSHFLCVSLFSSPPSDRLNVCTNDKVPPYGPALPSETFTNMTEFRNLLFAKSNSHFFNRKKASPAHRCLNPRSDQCRKVGLPGTFLSSKEASHFKGPLGPNSREVLWRREKEPEGTPKLFFVFCFFQACSEIVSSLPVSPWRVRCKRSAGK